MSESKVKIGCGSSILPIGIFLIFLFLKLAKTGQVANWSWWWVTCPLWIGLAIMIIVCIVALVIFVIVAMHKIKQVR